MYQDVQVVEEDLAGYAATISDGISCIAPTAALLGWSVEDITVALIILSEWRIRGVKAGLALKSVMTNILQPNDRMQETMDELNVSLQDDDGKTRSLPAILTDLEAALKGMYPEQRIQYIYTLAGTRGLNAMNALLTNGVSSWQKRKTSNVWPCCSLAEFIQIIDEIFTRNNRYIELTDRHP